MSEGFTAPVVCEASSVEVNRESVSRICREGKISLFH